MRMHARDGPTNPRTTAPALQRCMQLRWDLAPRARVLT